MAQQQRARSRVSADDVMTGFPVPAELRVTPATIYQPPYTRWFMQHVREAERSAAVGGGGGSGEPFPLPHRKRRLDGLAVSGQGRYEQVLRDTHTDAFLVLHDGHVVDERYFNTMRSSTPHLWQSVSKSLASAVAGNLAARGVLDLEARVGRCVPELASSAYGDARVRHLLDMAVGIHYSEDYEDEDADVNELDRLYGARPPRSTDQPGSSYEFATHTRKQGRHGADFQYVSLNVNVLAWVMERATGVRMPQLIAREVWEKLGAEHEAYIALDGAGSAQSEGGFCSSLRDLGRFGLALSRGGRLGRHQVVPVPWVDDIMSGGSRAAFARTPEAGVIPGGSYHRGFWVSQRPGHTVIMGLGIYGQLVYVDARSQVVIAKFSTQPAASDTESLGREVALCDAVAAVLAG